jgi:hypothetical protein
MPQRIEAAWRRVQTWCEGQSRREAPYMPGTALLTAVGFPIFTWLQDYFDSAGRDSGWPFCLFLTGLFLHLAAGWGFEYQSLWRFNRPIGIAAAVLCMPFWVYVTWYMSR